MSDNQNMKYRPSGQPRFFPLCDVSVECGPVPGACFVAPASIDHTVKESLRTLHRLSRSFVRHLIVILPLLVVGCSAGAPFDQNLHSQGRYLCTNMRFNDKGAATDANYSYEPYGEMLLIGTRIVVSSVSANSIKFRTSDSFKEYVLKFVYGRDQLAADEYFRRVLCVENPTPGLAGATPETREAILQGRMLVGMSRRQILMARGYPPANKTPDLKSDRWFFFRTGRLVDEVSFQGDEVISVKSVRSSSID